MRLARQADVFFVTLTVTQAWRPILSRLPEDNKISNINSAPVFEQRKPIAGCDGSPSPIRPVYIVGFKPQELRRIVAEQID